MPETAGFPLSAEPMDIPLFPLHVVLCPGVALPLHVFEPRYRLLVERAIDASSPFGVVLIRYGRDVGSSDLTLAGVGTFAEIRRAGRHPDGRFELLVVGTGRFELDSVDQDREPYIVGSVTPLDEPPGDEALASTLADRTLRRFAHYLRLLEPGEGETAPPFDVQVEVETSDAPEADDEAEPAERAGASAWEEVSGTIRIPDDPVALSHLLSGIVQIDLPTRQRLLEAATAVDRLTELDRILRREVRLLEHRLRLFVPPTVEDGARRS